MATVTPPVQESSVVRTMRGFKADIARGDLVQIRRMELRWRAAINRLELQMARLAREMARIKAEGGVVNKGKLFQNDRYHELMRQMTLELADYTDFVARSITGRQKELGEDGIRHAEQAIRASGVSGTFNRLPVDAVEGMAGLTGDGSPLRQLLVKSWPLATVGVTQELVNGTALGYNPRKTARLMAQAAGGSAKRMQVIARTEQLRVYREANLQSYKQSKVVYGYQRLATHDKRVCAACLMDEGTRYALDEEMPEHPQGRCTMVPLVIGVPPPQWVKGEAWLAQQDPATQQAILGKGRYELWQEGGYDLKDLVTVKPNVIWGDSLQVTSLRNLRAGQFPSHRRRKVEEPLPPVTHLDDGFPIDLARLEVVKTLGGSTGAQLVRDPLDQKLYVMKRGKDAGHIREEAAADSAYRAMGVKVPNFHLYEEAGKPPTKLAEFIEGRTLDALRAGDKKAYAKAVKELRKNFASDALLGNWDVAGLSFDNVLVDNEGAVWRIDNGGALRYRGMGDLKATRAPWTQHPEEFWTMRNRAMQVNNSVNFELFGDLGYGDVMKQSKTLLKSRDAVIGGLPDDLKGLMGSRFDMMQDLVNMHNTLHKDKWVEGYIDDFAYHSVNLRKSGVIDKLPKQLTQGHRQKTTVYDENGKEWDNFRTYDPINNPSVTSHIQDYIQANGGSFNQIFQWSRAQAGSSWSSNSQGVKYFYAKQRDVDHAKEFFWMSGQDSAQRYYEDMVNNLGEKKFRETQTAWHAFNYEFMRNVEFPGNNIDKGLVKVMRTEDSMVMAKNNLSRGDKGPMIRGAIESTSIFEPFYLGTTELTTQNVPHHRIFGTYFLEQRPGMANPFYAGEHENEFLAMLEGVEVKHEKKSR